MIRQVALLLFGLALASALPQPGEERIDWPDRPSWWPEQRSWPPQRPERPDWLPSQADASQSSDTNEVAETKSWLPWPPTHPEWIPWPPAHPDWAPWPPTHPEWIPWPPAHPEEWPDRPAFWPESWPWPPTEHPENIPWPPIFPEDWERPSFWPEHWPWPPTEHPDSIPWPLPELPEDWPPRPPLWPESWPWPPTEHPESIPWPPPPVINPEDIPYNPARDNEMHLFTRENPTMSQPLVIRNEPILRFSNFDGTKRTIILIHDRHQNAISPFNTVLVPAFLAADDVNVIVVDWSAGARFHAAISSFAAIASSNFVAVFISWLQHASSGDLSTYHIVGLGLGAQSAGIIGRRLERSIGYITGLDPAKGPSLTELLPPLNVNAAKYTEVIHTDAGNSGYIQPMADTDFYPNEGVNQPGCATGDSYCNRMRAVHFFAESVRFGGFTGVSCDDFRQALQGTCSGESRLQMGGLLPKTGASGVYHLRTNAFPPFAQR